MDFLHSDQGIQHEAEAIFRGSNCVCDVSSRVGHSVSAILRKMQICEATFYRWKQKYAGLGVSEMRRLRQVEDENNRLKRLVADLTLDRQMLQDALSKKL